MIERINLIEKIPYELSYTKIVQIVVGVIAFCVLVFGVQTGWEFYQNKKTISLRSEIDRLDAEKKMLIKAAPPKIENGPNAEIRTIFTTTPRWADLLEDIGNRLPSNVWLTAINAANAQKAVVVAPSANNASSAAAKPAVAPPRETGVVVNGIATDAESMALFIQKLKASPFIAEVGLKHSEKEGDKFLFGVECSMNINFQIDRQLAQ